MQTLTFDEAALLWPRLHDSGELESEHDGALCAACEDIILSHDIQGSDDAALILQVLINDVGLGSRTDGLDVKALTTLRRWLLRIAG